MMAGSAANTFRRKKRLPASDGFANGCQANAQSLRFQVEKWLSPDPEEFRSMQSRFDRTRLGRRRYVRVRVEIHTAGGVRAAVPSFDT